MLEFFFRRFSPTYNFDIKIERDAGQGVIGINGDFIPLDFHHHNLLGRAVQRLHLKYKSVHHRLKVVRLLTWAASTNDQQRLIRIVEKFRDGQIFTSEQFVNMLCGAISHSHLNNFWWMSTKETPMEEIGIFGNDDETLLQSQLLDRFIVIAGYSHFH